MNTVSASRLSVFFEEELVGHVFDTSPLSFEYSSTWLQSKAVQIANISLGPGRIQSDSVTSFFENLLPEGDLRAFLFSARKASTLFGLLHAVAGDTAGGFVLLPAGQVPRPQQYEVTSWTVLAKELKTKAASAINLKGEGTRISLAGAQDKVSIAIFEDGVPKLGVGTSPSTHILKPDIKRIDGVWSSAINEAMIMRAASKCGLGVANVFFETKTRSFRSIPAC
jgi:serine/threonine-protein kinase HipA